MLRLRFSVSSLTCLGRSSEEVFTAVGERELHWLRKYGKPRYPHLGYQRSFYDYKLVEPEQQMGFLQDYLALAAGVIPSSDEARAPVIRHPDLSPSNIFVDDSGEVTAVIDWQRTVILPLWIHAKIPAHFQNWGDEDSEAFKPPKLAENFDTLDSDAKDSEMERFRRRQLHFFYAGHTSKINRTHFTALSDPVMIERSKLYDVASRPWEGDNTSLQAQIISILDNWETIAPAGLAPPVSYTVEERQECLERLALIDQLDALLHSYRDAIGINIDGAIESSEYEAGKKRARELKLDFMATAENEQDRAEFDEFWPYQDHEEVD